jgi:hypothetical protein
MAERPVTAIRKGAWLHFSWDTVTEADTCQPVYVNHNVSDILMEVSGTFGAATVAIDGGVTSACNVLGLVDPGGTAVGITAAGGSAVRDLWPFMQPSTSGGTSQDVDIEVRMKIAG